MNLRFTTTHTTNSKARSVVKYRPNQTIAEIIPPSYIPSSKTVILYEQLDVSVIDLETKRSLRVTWTETHNKERSTYPFLLSKTSTIRDLIEELSKQVQLTPTGTGRIKLFKLAKDGETQVEFSVTEMIGNIPDPVEVFAEEIPPEEPVQ